MACVSLLANVVLFNCCFFLNRRFPKAELKSGKLKQGKLDFAGSGLGTDALKQPLIVLPHALQQVMLQKLSLRDFKPVTLHTAYRVYI